MDALPPSRQTSDARDRTSRERTAPAKRNRSPADSPGASKVAKTHHHHLQHHSSQPNHLQINYLARRFDENIPLVSSDDTMSYILHLLALYDGVLHRHESIAGNMGASPLGPILVKRFERLFDGPPRVLRQSKDGSSPVTWLDVVDFAKNKPDHFTLDQPRAGPPVCHIQLKHARVEISEEDYILIKSGMPQKMIPPQPIDEDEEKELAALELLERNLCQIIQLADQVSARARQLNHRLRARKSAIATRRDKEGNADPISPWLEANGLSNDRNPNKPHSPPSSSGFVAINSRPDAPDDSLLSSANFLFSHPNPDNVTIINGTSVKHVSPSARAEIMKNFFTTADRQARGLPSAADDAATTTTTTASSPTHPPPEDAEPAPKQQTPPGPVAIPSTPTSLLPQGKSANHYDRDDGGPFKIEMVSRMEDLQRGDRILPPCDRCRRLGMDCLKNLTACMGCTKKHAKCSWKEVRLDELHQLYPRKQNQASLAAARSAPDHSAALPGKRDQQPLPPQTAPTPQSMASPDHSPDAGTADGADGSGSGSGELAARRSRKASASAVSATTAASASPSVRSAGDVSSSRLPDGDDDTLAQAIHDAVGQYRPRPGPVHPAVVNGKPADSGPPPDWQVQDPDRRDRDRDRLFLLQREQAQHAPSVAQEAPGRQHERETPAQMSRQSPPLRSPPSRTLAPVSLGQFHAQPTIPPLAKTLPMPIPALVQAQQPDMHVPAPVPVNMPMPLSMQMRPEQQ